MAETVRVLIVTNHFWPENFRINDLAFWLGEQGHDVTVLTGVPDYPAGRYFPGYGIFSRRSEVHRGVRIRRFPHIPRGQGKSWNLVLHYLTSALASCVLAPVYCRTAYDVIFVFETSPVTIGLPALIVRKMQGIPLVFWVLDLWPESLSATGAIRSPSVLGLARNVVRFIYKRCDLILASSRGFSESIAATGGYRGKVEFLPNWVEDEYLSPKNDHVIDRSLLPEGFRIMFAGNIGAAQNFETILAAAELLRKYPDIHWVILGDGRRAQWVSSQVRERGLQDNFHLLGSYPPEKMPAFFECADVMLLPLRKDPIFALTVPGKLQSYLASGKPVIASLDGEGARIVQESGAGFACPAENPEKLAATVLKMYMMPLEDRKLMGERGRRLCTEHFSRTSLFNKLEGMLVKLAAAKNRERAGA